MSDGLHIQQNQYCLLKAIAVQLMAISFFSVDPEYFIECLRVFDRGCNGLVNASELRHVLCNLGDKLTLDEVNQLLAAFEDNTGHVMYEEFVKQVMTG